MLNCSSAQPPSIYGQFMLCTSQEDPCRTPTSTTAFTAASGMSGRPITVSYFEPSIKTRLSLILSFTSTSRIFSDTMASPGETCNGPLSSSTFPQHLHPCNIPDTGMLPDPTADCADACMRGRHTTHGNMIVCSAVWTAGTDVRGNHEDDITLNWVGPSSTTAKTCFRLMLYFPFTLPVLTTCAGHD